MKLVSITWSNEDSYDYKQSILFRSFIKLNDEKDFINIHFNRTKYSEMEIKFEQHYGFQYEFILYKIFLFRDILNNIDDDHIVYCDTNDVVCLDNINKLGLTSEIIFSSEKHKYPSDNSSWGPVSSYPDWNLINNIFLNSGLILSTKKFYIDLLDNAIKNILPLHYKNFGGDQGIYTYHYINNHEPKIILDHNCNYFVSTYLTSQDWYEKENNKFRNKITGTTPMFVHDNGWNYGSPRIIERFNLV